ncbi:hypothetical protein BDK61_0792 [Haloarcula quadrata]|uniref:Uncharacterized protein n=1 Tax=Haloarcula quadrata TaxID=182779 RepID=A0A495R371_9EURY|nr:hypothetical protein [Haloarcula quadrata]RKS81506.1 hypothetical protein BDK61_0792 [Haloarcula quadrata]
MPTSDEILNKKPPEFYRLLSECVEVAEHRGTIYYETAGELIGVIAVNMNNWSAAISKEMVQQGHPMISAVIVGQGDDTPGDGFYTLAYDIGRLDTDPTHLTENEKREFWKEELQRVYRTFAR